MFIDVEWGVEKVDEELYYEAEFKLKGQIQRRILRTRTNIFERGVNLFTR
jgi:hypothetical protein